MSTVISLDFVPALWRVTILLAAVGLLELLLRRKAASLRHLLWSSALAGALAMPLLSGLIPRWRIPVWEDLVPAPGTALFRTDVYGQAAAPPESAGEMRAAQSGPSSGPASRGVRWLGLLWLAGALAVCVQVLVGVAAVVRLRRKARNAPEAVSSLAAELAAGMGVRQRVRVLSAGSATTPMTWGIVRPVVLLPETVVSGSPERLRAVLLHELAHIARRDFPLHLIGQAACAVYWFHPLAWLARRRALGLRERASDDMVLAFGVKPSDYAMSLLQLSRSLAAPRLCSALGICRTSRLEGRVKAILDPAQRRDRPSLRSAAFAAAVAVLLAAVLAAASPSLVSMEPPAAVLQTVPAPDFEAIEAEASAAVAAFDLEKAASLYRKAADAKMARFGAMSTQHALDLIRLGAFYRSWDRLEEAHPFYAEARDILEKINGPAYPGLAAPLYFLALEAHLKEDVTTAEGLYRRVVDLWEQPPSLETALAKRGLAIIAQKRGEAKGEALPEIPMPTVEGSLPAGGLVSGTYRPGGGVTAPTLVSKVEPQYSREARLLKWQGMTTLAVVVEGDGSVHEAQVRKPLGLGLDAKAVEAIRQWRFQPGMKDGAPVRIQAMVEFNFRLL